MVMRDHLSYCNVLLDSSNRKPICRFHFSEAHKYLGLFDEQKHEARVELATLDNIYDHADALKVTAISYDIDPSRSAGT